MLVLTFFGVGERLITSKSSPVLDGVYKLVAVEDEEGNITPKIKISENIGKSLLLIIRRCIDFMTVKPIRHWLI